MALSKDKGYLPIDPTCVYYMQTKAGGTGPVDQAKIGPLFTANSAMIVTFTNAICMKAVIIVTISLGPFISN